MVNVTMYIFFVLFGSASKSNLKIFEITQNKALRAACIGVMKSTPCKTGIKIFLIFTLMLINTLVIHFPLNFFENIPSFNLSPQPMDCGIRNNFKTWYHFCNFSGTLENCDKMC